MEVITLVLNHMECYMKNMFNFKTVVAVAGLCAGLSTAGAMDLTAQQKNQIATETFSGAYALIGAQGTLRAPEIVNMITQRLENSPARYSNDNTAFASLVQEIAGMVATMSQNSAEVYFGLTEHDTNAKDDYNRYSTIAKLTKDIAEGKEIFSLSLDFQKGLDQKIGSIALARSANRIPAMVRKSQERKDEAHIVTSSPKASLQISQAAQQFGKTQARHNLFASIHKGTSLTASTVSAATPSSSTSSTTTHVAEQPAATPKPLQFGGQQPTDLMAAIRNAAGKVKKKSSAIVTSQPTMSLQPTAPFEQPETETITTMLVQPQPSTSSSSSSNPKIELVNRLTGHFVGEYMISRDVFEALSLDILKKIDTSTLPMEALYAAISINELDMLG